MYEIVVGIPSYNSVETISYVVRQVEKGLSKYFQGKNLVLVSDGGSTDGTIEVVKALKVREESVDRRVELYPGPSGKGSAVKHVFKVAEEEGASTVVLVDSDLRSITPEWIKFLGLPASGKYDLVTPLYRRDRYDGMITKLLAYPLTRALYGLRVRQPIGGDFGLSIELVKELLREDLWSLKYVQKYGIDIFITNTALSRGFRVAQVFLGSKIHGSKDPTAHLKNMFLEVSGSQFNISIRNVSAWWNVEGSVEPETMVEKGFLECAQPIRVDIDSGVNKFKAALRSVEEVARRVLKEDFCLVENALDKACRKERNAFPSDAWSRVVYRHLAFYASNRREEVLESLYACWLGRIVSFVVDTLELSDEEVEREVLRGAEAFEGEKSFLRSVFPERKA